MSIHTALVKAAMWKVAADVSDQDLRAIDMANARIPEGARLALQVNANPLYKKMTDNHGGVSTDLDGVTMYHMPLHKDYSGIKSDVGKALAKDIDNAVAEKVIGNIKGNKGGSTALDVSSKYLLPLGLLAPVVGTVGGAVGETGAGRGLLRGVGTGVGGAAGALAGAKIGDALQGTDFVRKLSPNAQAAISLASVLGGTGVGGYVGHRLARAASKTKKEEYEDSRN